MSRRSVRGSLILVCVCGLVLLAIGLLLRSTDDGDDPSTASSRAPRSTRPSGFSRSSAPDADAQPVDDRIIEYALELATDARFDLSALAGDGTGGSGQLLAEVDIAVQGRLERLHLFDDELGAVELLRMREVNARHDTKPTPASDDIDDAIAAALRQGIVVRRSPMGAVQGIRLPIAMSAVGDGPLRQLAEQTQLGRAPAESSAWQATESSVAGGLQVEYEHTPDGGLQRRLVGVEAAASGHEEIARTTTVEGTYALSIRDGVLASIEGSCTTSMGIAGSPQPVAISRARIGLRHASERRDAEAVEAAIAGLDEAFGPWMSLHDAPAGASAQSDAELVAGRDLRTLLDELTAALQRGERHPMVLAALLAHVRSTRGAAAELARAIAEGSTSEEERRLRVGVLAQVGDAEAQAALAELARAAGDDPAFAKEVVSALVAIPAPTEATEQVLRELGRGEDSVAQMANLGLGTVARRVAETDGERADAIVEELLGGLRDGGDDSPAELVERLAALSNTRSPEILDEVVPYLEHDDPYVRQMAAAAVASVDGERADRLLAGCIGKELDGPTLVAIVRITERRSPSAVIVEAMIGRLEQGIDDSVALALLDGIARGMAVAPGARAVLEGAAAREGDVGDHARRLLSQL